MSLKYSDINCENVIFCLKIRKNEKCNLKYLKKLSLSGNINNNINQESAEFFMILFE